MSLLTLMPNFLQAPINEEPAPTFTLFAPLVSLTPPPPPPPPNIISAGGVRVVAALADASARADTVGGSVRAALAATQHASASQRHAIDVRRPEISSTHRSPAWGDTKVPRRPALARWR